MQKIRSIKKKLTKQRNTAIETKKLKIIIEGKSASKKKGNKNNFTHATYRKNT